MCVPGHVHSRAGHRSLFRAIEQFGMGWKIKKHLLKKNENKVNSLRHHADCAFSLNKQKKYQHASKTFGTLKTSISSRVTKLPLQSQLQVLFGQSREPGLWRTSILKQIGDQGGARQNPCGSKELMLLSACRICDICIMIPCTVSFSVLSVMIRSA